MYYKKGGDKMNILAAHDEQVCPYNGINVCMASFSLMAIDTKKDNCCTTDNYDNCPIFLSKVLRRS